MFSWNKTIFSAFSTTLDGQVNICHNVEQNPKTFGDKNSNMIPVPLCYDVCGNDMWRRA